MQQQVACAGNILVAARLPVLPSGTSELEFARIGQWSKCLSQVP